MTIFDIMETLVSVEGSDIHLVVGSPPTVRIHGDLRTLEGTAPLDEKLANELILPLMTQEQKDYVRVNKELDFGYTFQDKGRFRINVYTNKGTLGAAMRLIPTKIKTVEDLNLPPIVKDFTNFPQGLVLVTGPTGEGKSTTLAALIDLINATKSTHIVTIEDPIEFVYEPKKSIISQRELNHDTNSWEMALRSVLREDPNVVLIGEMRDYETIAAALTIAETGHLVFGTLHTATAAETIDRIVDVFPAHQQGQVRQQLAATIRVIASQRLLKAEGGGRVAGMEILVSNSAVKNLIREGKTHQIDTVIQTGADKGMILFEGHLVQLMQRGEITLETAMEAAFRPGELQRLMGKE